MHPSDHQIIEALLSRDEQITHDFFFVWCRPLIYSLINKVFNYEVDYDELVNELYIFLMEDDGRRLRSFQGRSSIYQWLKCVATRFFIEKRDQRIVIEDVSSEPPYPMDEATDEHDNQGYAREDLNRLLALMQNTRHRHVLQRLLLDDADYKEIAAELDTPVANVYNIKSRAWVEFVSIVLKEYSHE